MAAENPKTAEITFTILDCYGLKNVLDILKSFRNESVLRFSPKGISIFEAGAGETSTQHYEIFGNELLDYFYPFTEEEMPVYHVGITADQIFNIMKPESKKEMLKFIVCINLEDYTTIGFYPSCGKSANRLESFNKIRTCSIPKVRDYTDYYEDFYKDVPPTCRVATMAFVKAYTTIKAIRCNNIRFVLDPDGFLQMQGCVDDHVETVINLSAPDEEVPIDSNANEESDFVIEDLEPPYQITLKISNIIWFHKLARLSQSSICKIYILDKKPLVIRTNLGSGWGVATFSFNNDLM